jgi:hypothetical protein
MYFNYSYPLVDGLDFEIRLYSMRCLCILKSYIVHYSSSLHSDYMNTFIPSLSLDRKQGCGIFIYRVAWRPGGVIEWGGAEHTGPALITQRASFWQPFSSGCPPAGCTRSQREKEEKRMATAIVCTLNLERTLDPILHKWFRDSYKNIRWVFNHTVFPLIFKIGNDNLTILAFSSKWWRYSNAAMQKEIGLPVVVDEGRLMDLT